MSKLPARGFYVSRTSQDWWPLTLLSWRGCQLLKLTEISSFRIFISVLRKFCTGSAAPGRPFATNCDRITLSIDRFSAKRSAFDQYEGCTYSSALFIPNNRPRGNPIFTLFARDYSFVKGKCGFIGN